MRPDDRKQGIFGVFDGLASALGVIVATAATGNAHTVVVAAVALAVGAAVSMAAGEWLSDASGSGHRAAVMGSATLAGSILPAVPFFAMTGAPAFLACGVVTILLAALIAQARPGGALRSYSVTFAVLGVAASLAVATSLAAGAVV